MLPERAGNPNGNAIRVTPALSITQRRLWFLEQLAPGSTQHMICAGYELRGPVDVAALAAALTDLTARHDALRMNVTTQGGRPVVRVRPPEPVHLPVIAPPEDRVADPRSWVPDYISAQAGVPFDLASEPLLRTRLLRLDAGTHVLLLFMHHLVVDAWSMQIVVTELGKLYAARRTGEPADLPTAPSYFEFAAWQARMLESPSGTERELAYWRTALAGAPPLTPLPTDRPRPAAQTFDGAEFDFRLPVPVLTALRALAGSQGASLFMATLAAFAMLLGRYDPDGDVVIGVPVAGRVRPEDTATVGFFVNTVAVRIRLGPDPTFREALRAVRRSTLDTFEHTVLPFDLVIEGLGTERELAYNPVVQTIFQLLYAPRLSDDATPGSGTVARWHDLRVCEWDGGGAGVSTRFDFELHLRETDPETVDGVFCYRPDLFDRESVEALAADFQGLLAEATTVPDRRLSTLRALDRDAVLDRALSAGAPPRVPGGADDAARARPAQDAMAVTTRAQQMTYAVRDAVTPAMVWHPVVPVRVCDPNGRPLPRGAFGEVWVRDPDARDGGLLRTGALGRLRWDNTLELHGTIEEELRVRGISVPARVVEDALTADPTVARAIVVTRATDRELVAFLLPDEHTAPGRVAGPGPDTRRLRAALHRRLPRYLVPAEFEWLPTGSAGEPPDRRALAQLPPRGAGPRVYRLPGTSPTE